MHGSLSVILVIIFLLLTGHFLSLPIFSLASFLVRQFSFTSLLRSSPLILPPTTNMNPCNFLQSYQITTLPLGSDFSPVRAKASSQLPLKYIYIYFVFLIHILWHKPLLSIVYNFVYPSRIVIQFILKVIVEIYFQ